MVDSCNLNLTSGKGGEDGRGKGWHPSSPPAWAFGAASPHQHGLRVRLQDMDQDQPHPSPSSLLLRWP